MRSDIASIDGELDAETQRFPNIPDTLPQFRDLTSLRPEILSPQPVTERMALP